MALQARTIEARRLILDAIRRRPYVTTADARKIGNVKRASPILSGLVGERLADRVKRGVFVAVR